VHERVGFRIEGGSGGREEMASRCVRNLLIQVSSL
jgi:hypothetical protein